MTFARRSGVALAIAGSVLTLAAAAAPRVFTPGYTYRMRITGQTTEPNGKTKDYVVMSGRAMVTAKAGRLDIDEASKERGAMGDKGGYILYDPSSMMIVSPKDKQILKFTFEDIEKGMGALANTPGMRIAITDVAVNFEKLGPGEPLLGMSTTKYRITQDYKIAIKVAFMNRNSTERIVQDYWMADQKSGFSNPFARMGSMRPVGGGAFADLMTKTAEATAKMGNGIPVKTFTTTTSTSDKGEKTTNTATMEVTELQSGNVDDALLVAPSDYQVMDMGAQTKAMAAQAEQNKAAQGQATQAGEPAEAAQPDSGASAKGAAKEAGGEAVKEAAKKGLRGMGGLLRRP